MVSQVLIRTGDTAVSLHISYSGVAREWKEKSEPMRESLSTLKPEIVGLSFGSILSFGVGIFALVTNNPGLATVMAGPFLASILGFSLLWIGLRRNRR